MEKNNRKHDSTFVDEISRTKKGIAVAWLANFLVLELVWVAAMIALVATVGGDNVNADSILKALLYGFLTGLPVVAIVLFGAMIMSKTAIKMAVGGKTAQLSDGMIYNLVEEMSLAAGLPQPPKVYVVKGLGIPNAYALEDPFGKPHNGSIFVTEELGYLLNREQLQAVIAHEMSHIINRDTRAMTQLIAIGAVVAAIQSMFFYGALSSNRKPGGKDNPILIIVVLLVSFLIILAAPALSDLARAYMSRQREQQADNTAVSFCRNPTALAEALLTIEQYHEDNPKIIDNSLYNVAGAMTLYSPPASLVSQDNGFFENLRSKIAARGNTSTHPPTDQRVSLLESLGANVQGFEPTRKTPEQISPYIIQQEQNN